MYSTLDSFRLLTLRISELLYPPFKLLLTNVAIFALGAVSIFIEEVNADELQSDKVIVKGNTFGSMYRLRIDWDIKDAEYRQEVLALTPLGSDYNEVITFVRSEWRAENRKLNPSILKGNEIVRWPLVFHKLSFAALLGDKYKTVLDEQPPHIKLADPHAPFTSMQGKGYIISFFRNRPVWWKRELYVSVIYIFDDHSKLIDAFARGGVVTPLPW